MDSEIQQTSKRWFKKLLTPKLIFLVIGIIILGEVIIAVRSFRKPVPGGGAPAQIQPLSGGRIDLIARNTQYKVGENIPVTIRVATGGHPVSGVDAIIRFDPQILEATGSSVINKGKIFAEYPLTQIDSKQGTISISGIASSAQKSFNGVGIFANLNLKGKKVGATTLAVEFKEGETSESNVIESANITDILDKVQNLEVTIR